jgi:hypothetical protein
MLAANFGFYSSFRPRVGPPAPPGGRDRFEYGTPDGYDYYLNAGPLATANERLFGNQAAYWQEIIDHTTYDEFWQKRSLWKFAKNVKCAVLNVGGWFDAEDPIGPLYMYRSVEKNNPGTTNLLVMGPWSHGGWSRGDGEKLGNVGFGMKTSAYYREQIEFPFFMQYLKDKKADLPEASVFLTGINEFRRHAVWPPKNAKPMTLYFSAGEKLDSHSATESSTAFDEYVSDPNRPVPHLGYITQGFTSDYMTEDQRFASQRPDVLVYQTEPMNEDLIIAGPISVNLNVSTTGTDADFVVKLIDVYPGNVATPALPQGQLTPSNAVRMGGYQQLVRGEPFRGKYRGGFERPEAFVPGQPARIGFDLPDVYHAFRKGHRIMVHVQSSWFPLVDRNPQKFMEIPTARQEDFQKATHRVYRGGGLSSSVSVWVEEATSKVEVK